jgi:hypothetical protein
MISFSFFKDKCPSLKTDEDEIRISLTWGFLMGGGVVRWPS